MPRPVHFEIHASNPERAIKFYQDTFGWTFNQWSGGEYWIVLTGRGEGIDGGLIRRQGPEPENGQPVNAFPMTVDVDDLDRYFNDAIKAGGTAAVPRMAVPGVGWLAYVKDTEGNILGMMQNDPAAK